MFRVERDTISFGGSLLTPIGIFRWGSHARTLGILDISIVIKGWCFIVSLSRERVYEEPEETCCVHEMWDYGAYCYTHKYGERGAAIEGFAALLMLVLVVGVFCYWFGTALFSVTINFSDIISGLF